MTSTKERILNTSLALFNREGERNVTTNHIAEALGISPGNLYYHFRNKGTIVAALFERYSQNLLALLEAPQGPLTWTIKTHYFEGLLASMWQYRFFHRDLTHFLHADPALAARYQAFVEVVLERGLVIYWELRSSGIIARVSTKGALTLTCITRIQASGLTLSSRVRGPSSAALWTRPSSLPKVSNNWSARSS